MASRRMFSKDVVRSGTFLRMPPVARNLYYDLGMDCDDDGYCDYFTAMLILPYKEKDLHTLQDNGFIIIFDSDILGIIHHKENNQIRKNRKKDSKYKDIYSIPAPRQPTVNQEAAKCPQRLGEVRVGKVSKEKIVEQNDTPYTAITSDLNKRTGKKDGRGFQVTDANKTMIDQAMKTAKGEPLYKDDPVQALYYVNKVMAAHWKDDDKMKHHLSPSTLYQSTSTKDNFSKYLRFTMPESFSKDRSDKNKRFFDSFPVIMALEGRVYSGYELKGLYQSMSKDDKRGLRSKIKDWKGLTPDDRDRKLDETRNTIPPKIKKLINSIGG